MTKVDEFGDWFDFQCLISSTVFGIPCAAFGVLTHNGLRISEYGLRRLAQGIGDGGDVNGRAATTSANDLRP